MKVPRLLREILLVSLAQSVPLVAFLGRNARQLILRDRDNIRHDMNMRRAWGTSKSPKWLVGSVLFFSEQHDERPRIDQPRLTQTVADDPDVSPERVLANPQLLGRPQVREPVTTDQLHDLLMA
jgi:hypothetical protein|tara:strand:+ start:11305 stop:11676 length:372 start_codon:yes stop_codon:yes gene_type:complete